MEKTYTYMRRYFVVEVILTGLICIAALIICPILAYQGFMPGIMLVLMIPAFYQAWNTFVAIANPKTVTIDDQMISFGAWGRSDTFRFDKLRSFQVREFPSAGKMYIRIDGGNWLHGRYWLQTRVMTDGKELFQRLCDTEYRINPNTLKARARRVNARYIAAEEHHKCESSKPVKKNCK